QTCALPISDDSSGKPVIRSNGHFEILREPQARIEHAQLRHGSRAADARSRLIHGIKRRHCAAVATHVEAMHAVVAIRAAEPGIGWGTAEPADPASQERAAVAKDVVIEAE